MTKSPLAGWIGGKFQLAKQIIERIPEHECYCEPFAGAAWVLFRKPPSTTEVINDINRDVVTLYRVVQHHLDELVRWFRWALASRDEFQRLMEVDPVTLTDIQRSARFYYLQKLSFGGKVAGRTLGTSTTRPPRLNLLRIEQELSDAHLRLARVMIENLGYADCISRYDRPHTFFYLDPPYWGCEDYYGRNLFSRQDFETLADQLAGVQGRWLLSINDVPEIRAIFSRFRTEETSVRYSCARQARDRFGELLIRNY